MVAGIEVVRLRRPLGGQGVDLCQVRNDAQPLALGADAARRGLGELADLAVGEAQLLGLTQGGLVEGRRLLLQLAVHPDDGLDGMEEPGVDPRELVDASTVIPRCSA